MEKGNNFQTKGITIIVPQTFTHKKSKNLYNNKLKNKGGHI